MRTWLSFLSLAVLATTACGGGEAVVGSDSTLSQTTQGPSTIAPTTTATGDIFLFDPPPLPVFAKGRLYGRGGGGGETPAGIAEYGPPIEYEDRVYVQSGRWGDPFDLDVLDGPNSRRLVAGITSFVASDQGLVISRLIEEHRVRIELVDPETGSVLVAGPETESARVHMVGPTQVAIETGDGAVHGLLIWDFESGAEQVVDLARSDVGRIMASDPATGQVVVTQGDGPCWSVEPSLTEVGLRTPAAVMCTGPLLAQFSPDGSSVATIGFDPLTADQTTFVETFSADGSKRGHLDLGGATQVSWIDPASLAILTVSRDRITITRCDADLQSCNTVYEVGGTPLSTGEVWLVTS